MRLWKRASGLLKDQNSLLIATLLTKRSAFRNPDIEAAVIKATSHDEDRIDYKSFDRVYQWLNLSDANVKPVVRCISARVRNTRSWHVALKGLMLMHGVYATRVSVVKRIGRLPFDLSSFRDGHSRLGKTWCLNAFIRAYYFFLDHKSVLIRSNLNDRKGSSRWDHSLPLPGVQEIEVLEKVQALLDLLLQVKPQANAAYYSLIKEAMDGIVNEVFDIYSRTCKMIVILLKKMGSAPKFEATMILKLLHKAGKQGNELSLYFELCREIGVTNASKIPEIQQISQRDMEQIELMVNGISEEPETDGDFFPRRPPELENAMAMIPQFHQTGDQGYNNDVSRNELRTIITSNWEKFDDDLPVLTGGSYFAGGVNGYSTSELNPFLALPVPLAPQPYYQHSRQQELPDLITF